MAENVVEFPKKRAPRNSVIQLVCPDCGGDSFYFLMSERQPEELALLPASVVCVNEACDYSDLVVMSWLDEASETTP